MPGRMDDRKGGRTRRRQDKTEAGQDGGRTERRHDRKDRTEAGQSGGIQDRRHVCTGSHVGQEGWRRERMRDRRNIDQFYLIVLELSFRKKCYPASNH